MNILISTVYFNYYAPVILMDLLTIHKNTMDFTVFVAKTVRKIFF